MNLRLAGLALFSVSIGVLFAVPRWSASAHSVEDKKFSPSIPRTWDDKAMAELEVPLADASASPKQVPADFYYQIPVRAIYKDYPVYAPGHEPPGYFDWLKNQEPVILWDDKGHEPPLATEADWIKAGEIVFDSPIGEGGLSFIKPGGTLYVRNPDFYDKTKMPVAADGTVPFYRYVVRKKGEVAIGILGCAMCHTHVMPDGSVLKGAQGSFPFDRAFAYNYRQSDFLGAARGLERFL